MRVHAVWIALAACAGLAACGGETSGSHPGGAPGDDGAAALPVLQAAPVLSGTSVRVDGSLQDPVWARAAELVVPLTGKGGPKEVKLKAAYDAHEFYLLAIWKDEAISYDRYWKGRKDGTWELHQGQDAFEILWSPPGEDPRFREQSCALYCHGGHHGYDKGDGFADVWQWGAQTTAPFSQAHDLFLPFGPHAGGMRGDSQPGDSDNVLNRNTEFKGPAYVPKFIRPKVDRLLSFDNSQPLTEHILKARHLPIAGWEVALDLLRKARGSRGDVRAIGRHLGDHWILELARARDTGERDDLSLADASARPLFAVAVQDGSPDAEHATSGALELRFVPAPAR